LGDVARFIEIGGYKQLYRDFPQIDQIDYVDGLTDIFVDQLDNYRPKRRHDHAKLE